MQQLGMRAASAHWIDYLSDEDLAFVKRLVLASGSLKAVAAGYGISYPTYYTRRLDRLIAKITITESTEIQSEFERVLRAQHAEGKIDADTLKTLLAAYRQEGDRTEIGFSLCLVFRSVVAAAVAAQSQDLRWDELQRTATGDRNCSAPGSWVAVSSPAN